MTARVPGPLSAWLIFQRQLYKFPGDMRGRPEGAIKERKAVLETKRVVDFAASHNPVFVVGMERGGTSILQKTLATAPEFSMWNGEYETFVFDDPIRAISDDARDMTRAYLGGDEPFRKFQAWFATLEGWPAAWKLNRRVATGYFYFASQFAKDGARILEKTPRHALSLQLMMRFFPKARIIGILRHPFGVVESYRGRLKREQEMGKTPENYSWLDRTPDQILAHIDKIARAVTEAVETHPGQVMSVSYEEVMRDPELVFHLIGEFCDLPGIVVKTTRAVPKKGKMSGSDPLLRSGGIVTGNSYRTSLSLEDRVALVRKFPDLFERTTGLRIPHPQTLGD
jgi:hypothetical protein